MRPQAKRNQNKNFVLKNSIQKDQTIVGKNSILVLLDKFPKEFKYIIVPSNFTSPKVLEIISKANKLNISVIKDSSKLNSYASNLNLEKPDVIGVLNQNPNLQIKFKDVKEKLNQVEKCTILAIPELDYEQNLGSIIRTALGLKVDYLLVSNRQQKVFSTTVTKVSMGYNYLLPIIQENFLLAISEIKDLGFDIVGLDMGGENIFNFQYNPKTCIVIGKESIGLTEAVAKKCTRILSIPMDNVVESLNVSTSVGIVLYDMLKKETGLRS